VGKSGHNTKDFTISHNFNEKKAGGMTQKELKALEHKAKVDKIRLERELKKQEKAVVPMSENTPIASPDPSPPPDPNPDPNEEKEAKLANQMLNDLRYAYRHAMGNDGKKGRSRLMELLKSDAEFKFAMKELIKVEIGLVTSKLKAKEAGGNANQMVFVVLKGLKEEEGLYTKESLEDSVIDMKQVTNATNPDGTMYKPDDDVDKW
jgi:hypothetical protein